MKYILNLLLFLSIINCSSVGENNLNFYITDSYYDHNGVEISTLFYDSSSGVLKYRTPEEVIVRLDNEDKKQVLNFYNQCKEKKNSCWFTYDDETSSKFRFVIKTADFREIKCDNTKREDVKQILLLNNKIINLIKSKKEYKQAFPGESEVL